MEFVDFMVWKLGIFWALALLYGIWVGITQ